MSAVYVVGSINVDLVAFAARAPVPGETVRGESLERHLGGKGANQAVAAARAGARAVMVGAVGDDADGELVREALAAYGVDVQHVQTVAGATGVALIVVAAGDNRIVVVAGANDRVDASRCAALALQPGDVCVAQLETNVDAVEAAFRRARARGALTLFNPAPALEQARTVLPASDVVVVNESECAFFAGEPLDVPASDRAVRAAARALRLRPEQALVVTLGAAGAKAVAGGELVAIAGHPVRVVDTTGAGDCFCGYLAAGFARGAQLEAALREANAAAALAVGVKGAAAGIPARADVARALARSARGSAE